MRARSSAHSAAVQQAVVHAYPNVSAIDLGLVLQTFDGIFAKVSLVVRFMAMFVAVTGIIVLAGAVLTGRFQRVRENVLLRTLGATRRQVQRIMLVDSTHSVIWADGKCYEKTGDAAWAACTGPPIFRPGILQGRPRKQSTGCRRCRHTPSWWTASRVAPRRAARVCG